VSSSAHVLVLVLAVAALLFVVRLVALRQLRSKYALLWLGIAVVLLPFAAVPSLLDDVAHSLGFSYSPAFFFLLAIGFLFAVVVHFSWELSRLEGRVRTLAEELAIERSRAEEAEQRGTAAGRRLGPAPGDQQGPA
jgi:hypothetical protein